MLTAALMTPVRAAPADPSEQARCRNRSSPIYSRAGRRRCFRPPKPCYVPSICTSRSTTRTRTVRSTCGWIRSICCATTMSAALGIHNGLHGGDVVTDRGARRSVPWPQHEITPMSGQVKRPGAGPQSLCQRRRGAPKQVARGAAGAGRFLGRGRATNAARRHHANGTEICCRRPLPTGPGELVPTAPRQRS